MFLANKQTVDIYIFFDAYYLFFNFNKYVKREKLKPNKIN